MASLLRFGIIGCGEIAAQTCQGISSAPNTAIAMLMDTRPEVLSDLAEFYHVPTTTDVDALLANPEVDAVYIATPHYLHAPLGIKAAEAGKHVLVEKPIATTLADADALIAACEKHNVKLGVAFYAQVDAAMAAARDLVRAGVLGKITFVRLSSLSRKPDAYWHGGYTGRVYTDWRTRKAQAGGGVLIMNVIHDLNTVRWVTGLEVVRVYSEMDTLATPVEVEDTIGVVMRYDNGAIGVVQAGSAMPGGAHQDAPGPRIYGTKGQLILASKPLIYLTEPLEGGVPNTWQELRFSGPIADRQQIVSRFAAAVLEGKEPPVTGYDGRKALEIVLAAYRSGELKQPVDLPLKA
jgi:UDP-N-acetyl-2-amino-2-deoxyglucuronate dehydrogenase